MRKNIARVIKGGQTIWSYKMPIAWLEPDGSVTIVPYASGPSRTTKSQICAIELAFVHGIGS